MYPKVMNKRKMPNITTVIQHILGTPSYSNQRREKTIFKQTGKGEVKFSLFTHGMI